MSGKSFINVNVYWINDDFQGEKKILTVFKFILKRQKITGRWLIKSWMSTELKRGPLFSRLIMNPQCEPHKEEVRNGCFSHIESKASQVSLKSSDRVTKARKKLRKIAKKSNKTTKLKSFIRQKQLQRSLTPKSLKKEVGTRFTAMHTMMRSFMNDPNERTDGDINEEKAKANIAAVNEVMRRVLKRREYDDHTQTDTHTHTHRNAQTDTHTDRHTDRHRQTDTKK